MILITRPRPEAKKLKKIVESLGLAAHIDSLSKITKTKLDNHTKSKKLVLISSQRAAKIFIDKNLYQMNVPILVIGNNSFQKLKIAGYSNILYKAKASDELLKYLAKNYSSLRKKYGLTLIYMTGSISNSKFIKSLNTIGYKIEKKITYKTIFKTSFHRSTIQLMENKKIKVCLIYSQKNAELFCKLVKNKNLFNKCKKLLILTLSKNIAQVMKKNGYINVAYSLQPTQASLIKKLKKSKLL